MRGSHLFSWVPEKSWKPPGKVPKIPGISFFGIGRHPVISMNQWALGSVENMMKGMKKRRDRKLNHYLTVSFFFFPHVFLKT